MSVSGFFSSIADKAQSAINQTPLAGHVPGTPSAGQPSANQAASQGGHRSFALESLQYTIRNIGQQYTSTNPMQRIITLEKGVALDFDGLTRDGKALSKELYTWGQHEDGDITDVTDRLAFLNYVQASLSGSLAVKLDGARTPLKALRDAEAALVPKRNVRAGLRNQIARVEHNQEKGGERRVAELKEQLARAERNDEQLEKEFELLKRKAIRESEQKKWDAIREYGEKLVLISQAAKPIIGALPSLPPTDAIPYKGAEITAAARAALQHALDSYKPGQVNDLDIQLGADLSRSDTRSFGESHANELNASAAEQDSHPGLSVTPPIPEPGAQLLDQTAAAASAQPPAAGEAGASPGVTSSGAGGLAQTPSEDLYDTPPPKTESAEAEKQRLEREERERVAASSQAKEERSETAEEEKKRLEREERERVLAGGADPKDGDELPPYKDLQE